MPVTAPRVLLLAIVAGSLWADEPVDAVRQAATALASGDAAAFAATFDASTPGLAQIRVDAGELIQQADAQSDIEFGTDTGNDRSRSLTLTWELHITAKDTTQGLTLRKAQVVCRVGQRAGHWRITSFEPRDFFRLPHVAGAWNVLESAATALSVGSANEFLSYFERSMAGYDKLANAAQALVTQGEVQSSLDMMSNEGSDTTRNIEVDWILRVVTEETTIHRGAREQRVKFRLQLEGKKWRIIAVEPLDFFSPISFGALQGESRRALFDR